MMSQDFAEPILSEEFIGDFLLKLSNEVYDYRVEREEFDDFRKERSKWNDTLKELDQGVIAQYDNVVTAAFAEYQEVLENGLIRQGIVQTIQGREAAEELPGLAEAAARLTAVCEDFVGSLEGEAAAQCAAYLKLRRETIDASRRLCWQCGAELAKGLLEDA